jgi:hypothetical protein
MRKTLFALFVVITLLASVMPVSLAEENDTEPRLRERLQLARQRYIAAKESYLEAKEAYLEKRLEFTRARQRVLECQGDNSTECIQVREQVEEQSREYLARMADLVLGSLEKIKARVEASEDLTEEEKEELIADLDERASAVEEAKTTVEESEDRAEILEAARLIRNEWIKTRPLLRRAAGVVISARMGGIIIQSERLEIKLNRILDRLENEGKDVAEAQDLVDDFGKKIDDAKESHQEAIEKFRAAKNETGEASHDLLVEGHKALKEAHTSLKEAREILRDAVAEIKAIENGSTAIQEADQESLPEENNTEVNETS